MGKKLRERIKGWKHEHEFAIRLMWVAGALIGLVILLTSLELGGFDVFGWLFSGKGGFVTFVVLFLLMTWVPYYLYSGSMIDKDRKSKGKDEEK